MDIAYIKSQFEHRDYFVRSEFIARYNFEDSYLDYYRAFVQKNLGSIHKPTYLSDLIDLSRYLSLFEQDIFNTVIQLFQRHPYRIVRISCLEYLEASQSSDQVQTAIAVIQADRKNQPRASNLIQHQRLMSLYRLVEAPSVKEKVLAEFLQSVKKTRDWRSIHRILNRLWAMDLTEANRLALLGIIKTQHERHHFGAGVEQLLHSL